MVDAEVVPGAGVLLLGSDFDGIGVAVTAPDAAPDDGTCAVSERTADDTSCIT